MPQPLNSSVRASSEVALRMTPRGYPPQPLTQVPGRWHYGAMPKATQARVVASDAPARVRRGYFECRFGQLHVHHAMPPGGGFEEGTALLCLHDLMHTGRLFTRLMPLCGRERSVYAPDLPGFGESDSPAVRPAVGDYIAALGDFIDSMRLRQLAVLGVRLGALLAAELATARPAQISRVVMVSVPLLTEAERHHLHDLRGQRQAPAPGEFRSLEAQRWAQEAGAQYPLRERLGRINQPLLILRPRDEFYEPTARVREVLPAVRLQDLEQTGPELFVSAPQRLADVLRDFLRG
jgi:pimeloyl-ACP methyl ester carboxylesterase